MAKSRLSIDLTEEEKAALEAYRRHHGLRSLNLAIRQLVQDAAEQMQKEGAK